VNDDEFDITDITDPMIGWTTMGTVTSHNINSAAKSMYYMNLAAAGNLVNGIVKTCPTIPFTVTMKLDSARMASNYGMAGLILAASASGALTIFGPNFDTSGAGGQRAIIVMKCSNPATFVSIQHYYAMIWGTGAGLDQPIYLRIIVTSSSNVTYQYSRDGRMFTTIFAASNPGFTIGVVGIGGRPHNATDLTELWSDWIRFT
jgi:hypothetical protein